MKSGHFLKQIYRTIQAQWVGRYGLKLFFSQSRIQESFSQRMPELLSLKAPSDTLQKANCIWFHAASVGELESLWPLVVSSAEKKHPLVLTILSESARGALEQLKKTVDALGAVVLFCGYSPWEGEWGIALQKWRPSLFVTAKYEAWPDLWMSLQEEKIPLAMVSVRARKSLRIARMICDRLGGGVPEMILFPCVPSEVFELRQLFPKATIEVGGEPRWDRVQSRIKRGNDRAHELMRTFAKFAKPWGVIGSAWLEDLEFLSHQFKDLSGTLWVVPHRVDPDSIQKIEEYLVSQGFRPIRTSKGLNERILQNTTGAETREATDRSESLPNCILPDCILPNFILVDEMGFLSELYSVADWAFVGGGFGAGVHSTIEPALHGIPIGAGPKGAEKFYEIAELSRTKQLWILRKEEDLRRWVEFLKSLSSAQKQIWEAEAKMRLGATQKILSSIEKFLNERVSLSS